MKPKTALNLGFALVMGFFATDIALNQGLGNRTKTVEYVFSNQGHRLGIVKEQPSIGRSSYYVQPLNLSIKKGDIIIRDSPLYKIYNYSDTNDYQDFVSVSARSYKVTRKNDSDLENN
jgi:hypothetical protein